VKQVKRSKMDRLEHPTEIAGALEVDQSVYGQFTVNVGGSSSLVLEMDSVGDAKQQIVRKTGMPTHLLHVWHAGKELLDNSAHVMSYGVEDGSHVQVLVPGLGGMDEKTSRAWAIFMSHHDIKEQELATLFPATSDADLQELVTECADLVMIDKIRVKTEFKARQAEYNRAQAPRSSDPGTSFFYILFVIVSPLCPARRHLWLCVTDLLRVLRLPRRVFCCLYRVSTCSNSCIGTCFVLSVTYICPLLAFVFHDGSVILLFFSLYIPTFPPHLVAPGKYFVDIPFVFCVVR
jgi:hypothetical protein